MNGSICERCHERLSDDGQVIAFSNEEHSLCPSCLDDLRSFMRRHKQPHQVH